MIVVPIVVVSLGTVPKRRDEREIRGKIETNKTTKSAGDLRKLDDFQTSEKLELVRKTPKE